MRIILACFLILSATVCAFAQTVQHGFVKEYNEKNKKTPLPGVELNVRSASSTVSNKNGDFALSFLTLKPGEKINVRRIEKLGYELFNKEAIEQWNLNPKDPFIIVMCKSEKFKKIRDNYEKVSSESYARQLKKEEASLAQLKKEGKIKEAEYQQQLFELRENYEKQLDNLDNYVDRFSRIDLSELSAVEQEIIALVQEGRIEEAIAKYEEQNYVEKYTTEVENINRLTVAINQLDSLKLDAEQNRNQLLSSIKHQIATLNLAGGEDNLNKIDKIYQNILDKDKSNLEIAIDYVKFLNTYNEYSKAIDVYNNVSTHFDDNDLKLKELILTHIGNSYNQLQQLDKAIDYYNKALHTLDSAVEDDNYIRDRKENILNNLGLGYLRNNDYKNALKYFEECLNLHNKFGDNNLAKIKCINNLASLYRTIKEYEKADQLLSDGLNILSDMDILDDYGREEILYSTAILTQGRGNVAIDKNDYEKALSHYRQTLSQLQSLYDRNPRKYAISLAAANHNYGRIYFLNDESSKEALPFFENAVSLYENTLNKCFIQQVADRYGETISLLGRIYSSQQDTTECIRLCDRINQTLKSCSDFPYKGANLLAAQGTIYSDIKMTESAVKSYNKAIDAMQIMYAEYPAIYKKDLSQLYVNVAFLNCKIGNLTAGKDYFNKGIPMWDELFLENKVTKKEYFNALDRGFLALGTTSEYQAGLNYLRKMQELAPDNRKLFEYECIILYGNGRIEEAKIAFSKLINHFPDYPTDSELYKVLGNQ